MKGISQQIVEGVISEHNRLNELDPVILEVDYKLENNLKTLRLTIGINGVIFKEEYIGVDWEVIYGYLLKHLLMYAFKCGKKGL